MSKFINVEMLGKAIIKLQNLIGNKVSKSGDTMTGNLSMGGNKDVTNVRELKGNKITTTSVSETEPNVKVESLKVRDDRVDILKKTTTNSNGSTSAVSGLYVTENHAEVPGTFKAKVGINTDGSIKANANVSASGNVETDSGMIVYDSYGGYQIKSDYDKLLVADFNGYGLLHKIVSSGLSYGYGNSSNQLIMGLKISPDGDHIRIIANDGKEFLELDSAGTDSRLNVQSLFKVVAGGNKVAEFGSNSVRFRVSDTCNFTGNITDNEFTMVGNYKFKDVAEHCTSLQEDTTVEEKAWLENYLHNLLIDLRRQSQDSAKKTDIVMNLNSPNVPEKHFLYSTTVRNVSLSEVELGNYSFFKSSVENVTTPSGVYILKLGDYCFSECDNLKEVTIVCPTTTSEYGASGVFEACKNLKKITIRGDRDNSTEIPEYFCSDCINLTNLNLTTVTDIGNRAFYNCTSLETVAIPSSVTSINSYAFDDCSNLTSITINKPQDSITGAPWGATNAEVIWNG